MNVRTVLWAVTCCATFVAGLLLGRGCSGSAPVNEFAQRDGATGDEQRAGPARANSAGRRSATLTSGAEDAADAHASEDASSRAVDAVAADADFPAVDVEVVWPNGDSAGGAIVYAYTAGGSHDDEGVPPNRQCDGAGRAQFHVVAPGRYDVGALLGAFQVLETDVELPRSGPVRLVLPEPCVVTVHMPERGGASPGRENESKYRLFLKHDADGRVSWPGRGETSSAWDGGVVGAPGSAWKAIAPRGARCRIEHDARYRVEPETFVAPADVKIVALPRYPVRIRVEFQSPQRRFDRETHLAVHFALTEESKWEHNWSKRLDSGAEVGTLSADAQFDTEFERPSGTLRWNGAAIVGGGVGFSGLEQDVTTTIVAQVATDPTWQPPLETPDATGRNRITLRIDARRPGDRRESVMRVFDASGGSRDARDDDGVTATFFVERPRWAIASRGGLVSEPMPLDDGSTGEFELPLVEGGWLVVVPASMPPDELGEPLIERADGRPFVFQNYPETSCGLAPGAALGPLVPGRISFRVVLRGRVLAEASADVVAGEHRPLVIPRLRAR